MPEKIPAVSVTQAMHVLSKAKPISDRVVRLIEERAAKTTVATAPDGPPRIGLTIDTIKQLIRDEKLAGDEILRDDKKLSDLAGIVFKQVKFKGRVEQGLFGSKETVKSLFGLTSRLYFECGTDLQKIGLKLRAAGKSQSEILKSEEVKRVFPKIAEFCKTFLALNKEVGGQVLSELSSGNYPQFRSTISSAFGGVVPHEKAVKFLFDRLNDPENVSKLAAASSKVETILKTSTNGEENIEIIGNAFQELIDEVFGKTEVIPAEAPDGQSAAQESSTTFTPGILSHNDILRLRVMMKDAFFIECGDLAEVAKGSEYVASKYPLLACIVQGLDPEQSQELFELVSKVSRINLQAHSIATTNNDGSRDQELADLRGISHSLFNLLLVKDSALIRKNLTEIKDTATQTIKGCDPKNIPVSLCFAAGLDIERIVSLLESHNNLFERILAASPEEMKPLQKEIDAFLREELVVILDGAKRAASDIITTMPDSADLHPGFTILSSVKSKEIVSLLTSKDLKAFGSIAEFVDTGAVTGLLASKAGDFLSTPAGIFLLEKAGIDPTMAKLLPGLLSGVQGGKGVSGLLSGLASNEAVQGIANAFGIKLPGVEKTTSDSTQTSGSGPGWGRGFGKWIVGGVSSVIAISGLFVENSFGKASLLGLGFLGLGGSIASAFKPVRVFLGFEGSSPTNQDSNSQDSSSTNQVSVSDLADLAKSFASMLEMG
jgi:hypothetical protein